MLDRNKLNTYIAEAYSTVPEFPWINAPGYAVYRHAGNKKWFAVIMDINKTKLGLPQNETVDVVNLKCDPILTGSLHKEAGIFPGYHMNKSYWITVLLDGSVDDDKIKWLLDLSYDLTDTNKRKKEQKD